MHLSLNEAAAILRCSPRTLRDRLRRGDLPGSKRGGRWQVDRRDLPLTDEQRLELTRRGEAIRDAVEEAVAKANGGRRRSIGDLETFSQTVELRRELQAQSGLSTELQQQLEVELECALLALAEGAHAWDRESKVAAYRRARRGLSRAAGRVRAGPSANDQLHAWADRLEQRALPTLGGLLRWAEGLESTRARR